MEGAIEPHDMRDDITEKFIDKERDNSESHFLDILDELQAAEDNTSIEPTTAETEPENEVLVSPDNVLEGDQDDDYWAATQNLDEKVRVLYPLINPCHSYNHYLVY